MTGTLTLGLVPTLIVEETIRFGPLTLSPVGSSDVTELAEVAQRFAEHRGAHPTRQAIVTCPEELRPIVPMIWPLFVFACVTFARREDGWLRGVPFPENFHLLNMTAAEGRLFYGTGHEQGCGRVEDIPLRWPVDTARLLTDRYWDRRIEVACTLLAKDPGSAGGNLVAVAAGMSADLANAAMERRSQKVENVAAGARAYVMLGSAFEALHAKGSIKRHLYEDVVRQGDRLQPCSTSLGRQLFSEQPIKTRPPQPEPGTVTTRPMFVISQLLSIRNTFAHGRMPTEGAYKLPPELSGHIERRAHIFSPATMLLAALIGDDLLAELGCTLSDSVPALTSEKAQHGVSFDLLHGALRDWQLLLRRLEETIVPAEERSPKE